MSNLPLRAVVLLGLVTLTAGCIAGNSDAAEAANDVWYLQLLMGYWHGLISLITIVLEFADEYFLDVPGSWRMFQEGTGPFYSLGFVVGAWTPIGLVVRRLGRPVLSAK